MDDVKRDESRRDYFVTKPGDLTIIRHENSSAAVQAKRVLHKLTALQVEKAKKPVAIVTVAAFIFRSQKTASNLGYFAINLMVENDGWVWGHYIRSPSRRHVTAHEMHANCWLT